MSLMSERVAAACLQNRTKTAYIDTEGVAVSFENFFLTTLAFSEQLQDRGVKAGDLVAEYIDDKIAYIATRLAVSRLGCTNITMGKARVLENDPVAVDWIIVSETQKTGDPREILVTQDWIRPPTRVIPPVEGARVVGSTSGTTGLPKLRVSEEKGASSWTERALAHRGKPDGPIYVGLNLRASVGYSVSLRGILAGVLTLLQGPSEEESLRRIVEHGVRWMYIPAGQLQRFVETAKKTGLRPTTLTRIEAGGGSISPQIALEAEDLFGCEVISSYGSSETGSMSHFRCSQMLDTPGAVGKLYDEIEYKFLDEDGDEQPEGTGGLLYVRIPDPTRVRNYPDGEPLCDADGWLKTGDIGHIIDGGILVLTGRESEFINIGGNKIAPSVIESAAREYPSLVDVAAFKVASPTGVDEIGIAAVLDDAELAGHFAEFVMSHFNPGYNFHILPVDAIPMSEAGKVDRKSLAAMLEQAAG